MGLFGLSCLLVSFFRFIGLSIDRWVGRLNWLDWLVGWMVGRGSGDWLVGLIVELVVRVRGWLVVWMDDG